jgi:hypothetical protein
MAMVMAVVLAAPALAQGYNSGHSNNLAAEGRKNVTLHVNPRWKECSFQLSPNLTQQAWRQFTGEAAVVTHFKPLIDARPMGRGKFELSVLQWTTGIDDEDAAWNDTFVHPDSTHWLFEGSGLAFPGLTGRVGITDRTDIGVYVTKNRNANYGFVGVQVQQNLLNDNARNWAASARVSFVTLYGPEDLENAVYGGDLVASRRYGLFANRVAISPYAGVTATVSRSHEKSTVVNLRDETVFGAQGTIGAVAELYGARLAAEYALARIPSMSLKVGFGR